MRTITFSFALIAFLSTAAQAQTYTVDRSHSAILFKAKHANVSYTYGMFRGFSGSLTVAGKKSQVAIEVDAGSVYTGEKKRDGHLASPDFLNAKQFPKITFNSTKVQQRGKSVVVAGKLTLHGVTKDVKLTMVHIGSGKGPDGKERIGFEGTLKIKRSAYGMTKMIPMVGDDVTLTISIEGIKQ